MKALRQEAAATGKRFAPKRARTEPTKSATSPDQILWVAFRMAGKVMTARATYGT